MLASALSFSSTLASSASRRFWSSFSSSSSSQSFGMADADSLGSDADSRGWDADIFSDGSAAATALIRCPTFSRTVSS